jgi:hypothetical protein
LETIITSEYRRRFEPFNPIENQYIQTEEPKTQCADGLYNTVIKYRRAAKDGNPIIAGLFNKLIREQEMHLLKKIQEANPLFNSSQSPKRLQKRRTGLSRQSGSEAKELSDSVDMSEAKRSFRLSEVLEQRPNTPRASTNVNRSSVDGFNLRADKRLTLQQIIAHKQIERKLNRSAFSVNNQSGKEGSECSKETLPYTQRAKGDSKDTSIMSYQIVQVQDAAQSPSKVLVPRGPALKDLFRIRNYDDIEFMKKKRVKPTVEAFAKRCIGRRLGSLSEIEVRK